MFVACGIWCIADVSSVSPSSEQTLETSAIHSDLTSLQNNNLQSTFRFLDT